MAYYEEVQNFPEIWEVEDSSDEGNPGSDISDGEIIDLPEPVERPRTDRRR